MNFENDYRPYDPTARFGPHEVLVAVRKAAGWVPGESLVNKVANMKADVERYKSALEDSKANVAAVHSALQYIAACNPKNHISKEEAIAIDAYPRLCEWWTKVSKIVYGEDFDTSNLTDDELLDTISDMAEEPEPAIEPISYAAEMWEPVEAGTFYRCEDKRHGHSVDKTTIWRHVDHATWSEDRTGSVERPQPSYTCSHCYARIVAENV